MRTKKNKLYHSLFLLRADILALEELSKHLFLELHDLQNMRERIDWSKSCQGKYFNFLGYFFSLYCVWKIFISTVNIVFDRVGKMDPITKTFDILVNWFGFDIDMEMWSQQLSFIVVRFETVHNRASSMFMTLFRWGL